MQCIVQFIYIIVVRINYTLPTKFEFTNKAKMSDILFKLIWLKKVY